MTPTLIEGWLHLSQGSLTIDPNLGSIILPITRLAQAAQTDLGASVAQAWDNFIASGQVWALMIGFFIGYIFRSITAY